MVGGRSGYANWMQGELVDSMKDASLVVFTGGEDISPELYGSRAHPLTHFNRSRDGYELDKFHEARKLGKKLIGVCRGAQLLCALAGGTLVQHQNHPYQHEVYTNDNRKIQVTSTHHQRQYPWGRYKPRFKLLAWADKLSSFSHGQHPNESLAGKEEVEIAYYPDIKALAMQPHPEMAYPGRLDWEKEFVEYCQSLLNKHMNGNL